MVRSTILTGVVAFLALLSSSQAQQLDWYALSQSNYAAIQAGLAELNAAATEMNRSLSAAGDTIIAAVDGIDLLVQQSIIRIWSQYPFAGLNLTMERLQNWIKDKQFVTPFPVDSYQQYVRYMMNDYKQSVTDNVMIPAQAIVRDNLNAMTTLYANMWSNCAQQNAQKLLQPQLSVGRLKQCISLAIPYFGSVANAMRSMIEMEKRLGMFVESFINLCTTESSSCMMQFLYGATRVVNRMILSATGFEQYRYNSLIEPGKVIVRECVSLIATDIQSMLQNITTCL